MKKKIAKIILSSGTLTTIAFIIILIPVLNLSSIKASSLFPIASFIILIVEYHP